VDILLPGHGQNPAAPRGPTGDRGGYPPHRLRLVLFRSCRNLRRRERRRTTRSDRAFQRRPPRFLHQRPHVHTGSRLQLPASVTAGRRAQFMFSYEREFVDHASGDDVSSAGQPAPASSCRVYRSRRTPWPHAPARPFTRRAASSAWSAWIPSSRLRQPSQQTFPVQVSRPKASLS